MPTLVVGMLPLPNRSIFRRNFHGHDKVAAPAQLQADSQPIALILAALAVHRVILMPLDRAAGRVAVLAIFDHRQFKVLAA